MTFPLMGFELVFALSLFDRPINHLDLSRWARESRDRLVQRICRWAFRFASCSF